MSPKSVHRFWENDMHQKQQLKAGRANLNSRDTLWSLAAVCEMPGHQCAHVRPDASRQIARRADDDGPFDLRVFLFGDEVADAGCRRLGRHGQAKAPEDDCAGIARPGVPDRVTVEAREIEAGLLL